MSQLLTLASDSVIQTKDPIAPIINPLMLNGHTGDATVSVGAAAQAAKDAVKENPFKLGINVQSSALGTLVLIGAIYLIWKGLKHAR